MEKNSFEYKNLIEIKKMSLEELNSYYRMLRKYEFETGKELSSSNIKKKIHSLTMLILKIDRLTTGRKLIVFDDKREKNIDNAIINTKIPKAIFKASAAFSIVFSLHYLFILSIKHIFLIYALCSG